MNVAGRRRLQSALDEALHANAFGAQNLVGLARALGDVPVFHTSTCYVAGKRKGPILEDDPRVFPFPRADELGADSWDPEREIAECLDLVDQANHRSEDAFRQSEFAEHGPQESARSRRARARRGVRRRARAREAQVRHDAPRRGRPRPRHPLGLAEHLHVHQGHRRAGHRVERPALHHRAARVLRVVPRFPRPLVQRGHQHERAAPLSDDEGAGARPGEARAARPHPHRLRRRRDDPRLRGAARGLRGARLPVRRERREPVHRAALRGARGHLQAQVLPARRGGKPDPRRPSGAGRAELRRPQRASIARVLRRLPRSRARSHR